jgi:hypothetical protein
LVHNAAVEEGKPRRSGWRRGSLAGALLAAALGLYWALGTLLGPGLIERAIERQDARLPGVEIRAGGVRVRPFRLRVELYEPSLRAPAGPGALVAHRAALEWHPTVLLGRAPRLSRLAIHAPHARLELRACCRHEDLQQVGPALQALFARLAPLRVDYLEVNDGRLELVGEAALAGRPWRLAGIRIRVHGLDPRADARYAIDIDDAAGGRLALDGLLALEARELHGRFAAPAAQGTFTAVLAAEDAALRLGAQWQPGEALPAGDSAPRIVRLEYAREAASLQLEGVPASSYSDFATQALGRGLAAGRLDLAIEQRRMNGRFEGSLQVTGDGLSLAPGPEALPVELALALLMDSQGSFMLRAPLAVDAGDDLGPAIALALQAEITRLDADPFAALGAVLGRPGAALQNLVFSPGSAAPTESLEAALGLFAEALEARPGLAVVVPAAFHPEHDRDALAARQVELHVTLATAEAAFRAQPAPLDFGSARVQDVLDEFAGERLAVGQIAALRSRFEEEENAAYYRALFDALAAIEPIADAALARLARFRGHAVRDGLAARGIAAERLVAGEIAGTAMAGLDSVVLRAELIPAPRQLPAAPSAELPDQ